MPTPTKLFVSYCHRDEVLREALDVHLAPLKRERVIEVWHDRMIVVGESWEESIEEKLRSADLFLFLVSPDFIASDYCYGKELTFALEQHRQGAALVLPIVVRPVDWKHTALGQIQALPKDGIPVTIWANADEAWLNVVNGIRTACKKISVRSAAGVARKKHIRTKTINDVLIKVVEGIQYQHDSENPVSGLPTGLAEVDSLIGGLNPKELVLVVSSPQTDRIGLIIRFVSNFAIEIGIPCAVVCAKHDEEHLGHRFLCSVGKLPSREVSLGLLNDDQWATLTFALGKMHEAPLVFLSFAGQTVDDLLTRVDELSEEYGALPVVAIDSLGHLSGGKAEIVHALRRNARLKNRLFIVGCGLENDPAKRPNKRPVVSDIGSWAPLNEDIDRIIFIYSDQIYFPDSVDRGVAELIFEGRSSGRSSTVRVGYAHESQSYFNLKTIKR